MKNIKDNVVIQIEVTNACNLSCANCSRLVGHHKKPFFMSLKQIKSAIASLQNFPGRIGLMGGEPTLHPKFLDICDLYQKMIPDRRKRELWTDGFKWDEYKDKIHETFDEDLIHYNDHSKPEEGWHQPVLVSIDEVLPDKDKMWKLIDNCWVQRRWSASITPKGAFFCEIAAALDHVFDGPGGWDIEPGWWKKGIEEYTDQKLFSCLKCSAALPMEEIPNNHNSYDYCSKGIFKQLVEVGSPKTRDGRTREMSAEQATSYLNSVDNLKEGERGYWKPSEFRTKVWHGPGEGDLTSREVAKLQRNSDDDLNNKAEQVAEIRQKDLFYSDKAFDVMKKELRKEVFYAIKNTIGNRYYNEEASLISLIESELNTKDSLSDREVDLILKFGHDPILR
jgi:hypothetical protein